MSAGIMHPQAMAAMAANRAPAAVKPAAAPWSLRLFALAILLPSEMSIRPAGLFLSPSRIILLVLAPYIAFRFGKLITSGRYRFVWSDLTVTLTGVWMLFSLSHSEALPDVLTHGGPMVLEFCVTYFAARVLLSAHGQALSLLNTLCLGIAVVGLLGMADTVSGHFVWKDLALSVFGGERMNDAGYRLGLLRATSTMDHPILFGFVCSVGLVSAVALPIRKRPFVICASMIGLILALSSAPIQSVLIALGLFAYERLLPTVRYKWTALLSFVGAVLFVVFESLDNPFGFIFNHLVFDTGSAYYRIYIWQTAGAVITAKPWYGIGYAQSVLYDIPSTVDSVWLVWSLQFGLPGALLFAASLMGSASLPTRGNAVRLSAIETRIGLTLGILIVAIILLGFTVHFFGEEWMLVPFLMGMRAHLGELGRSGTPVALPRPRFQERLPPRTRQSSARLPRPQRALSSQPAPPP
jgi:O-antigen ligase